jgi:DNA segregation ATPase FtsK/SpoIIIE-like protein
VLFLRRHALIGGTTGSGKSGCVNVIMANLTACTDTVIWAIDLKQGMELGPWADCLGRLATTPARARALLADAAEIIGARARDLATTGKRTWEPSPARPALVIVIDEYAELAGLATSAGRDLFRFAELALGDEHGILAVDDAFERAVRFAACGHDVIWRLRPWFSFILWHVLLR